MGALLGEPRGGAPLLGALKVMNGMLWGWASLFMGAQLGQSRVGSSTRDFEIWLKEALDVGCLSLCGSSVKGTRRGWGLPCWGP